MEELPKLFEIASYFKFAQASKVPSPGRIGLGHIVSTHKTKESKGNKKGRSITSVE